MDLKRFAPFERLKRSRLLWSSSWQPKGWRTNRRNAWSRRRWTSLRNRSTRPCFATESRIFGIDTVDKTLWCLQRLARKLVRTAGSFGFLQITNLASSMEMIYKNAIDTYPACIVVSAIWEIWRALKILYAFAYSSLEFNVEVMIRENSISKPFGMSVLVASSKKSLISSSKG